MLVQSLFIIKGLQAPDIDCFSAVSRVEKATVRANANGVYSPVEAVQHFHLRESVQVPQLYVLTDTNCKHFRIGMKTQGLNTEGRTQHLLQQSERIQPPDP